MLLNNFVFVLGIEVKGKAVTARTNGQSKKFNLKLFSLCHHQVLNGQLELSFENEHLDHTEQVQGVLVPLKEVDNVVVVKEDMANSLLSIFN